MKAQPGQHSLDDEKASGHAKQSAVKPPGLSSLEASLDAIPPASKNAFSRSHSSAKQHGSATVDDILSEDIGEMGRAQWLLLLVSGLTFFATSPTMFLANFTSAPTDPALDPTAWVCTADATDDPACHAAWSALLAVGREGPGRDVHGMCGLRPHQFRWTAPHLFVDIEFELVCSHRWKLAFLQTAFFVGFMTGNGLLGRAGDAYGRCAVMYLSAIAAGSTAFLAAISPGYVAHLMARVLSGATCAGACLQAYVLVSEFVGPSWRGTAGMLVQTFYIVGEFGLAGVAAISWGLNSACGDGPEHVGCRGEGVRGWRALSMATVIPFLLVLLTWRLVPESPRWLLSVGRVREATETLEWVARKNRRRLLRQPCLSSIPAKPQELVAVDTELTQLLTAMPDLVVSKKDGGGDEKAVISSTAGAGNLAVTSVFQRSSTGSSHTTDGIATLSAPPLPHVQVIVRPAGGGAVHNADEGGTSSGDASRTGSLQAVHQQAVDQQAVHQQAVRHQAVQAGSVEEERQSLLAPASGHDTSSAGKQTRTTSHQASLMHKERRPPNAAWVEEADMRGAGGVHNVGVSPGLVEAQHSRADTEGQAVNESLWGVLRNPLLARYFFAATYTMCSLSIAYFGVSLALGTLSGNIVGNFALTALAELPAYLIIAAMSGRVGRKPVVGGGALVAGVACTLLALVPQTDGPWQVLLAMAGKFGCSSAWALGITYVSELFPTSVRSMAVGAVSQSGDFGGILAPQLLLLGTKMHYDHFAFLIMGITSLVASLLVLLLPETLGMPQADSAEELLHILAERRAQACERAQAKASARAARP